MDPDIAFSGSTGWDFTMASGGRASLSQLAAPFHPRVFIYLHNAQTAPLLFLSHLINHILTHCGGSCCRLATGLVGSWMTSTICAVWHGGKRTSLDTVCSICGQVCGWYDSLQVSVCLHPTPLYFLVVARALHVYAAPVPWGRMKVCGHLSLPTQSGMVERRSLSIFSPPFLPGFDLI